jgi:riboflavin synthase
MFTGIIEEIGVVGSVRRGVKSSVISINGKVIFDDLKLGDSVSVNGVCLTVSSLNKDSFTADVMNETLQRSSLGELKVGYRVNLERAMPMNGRFGGHIVSGHIDGTGIITEIKREDISTWYTIKTTDKIMRFIIEKGSIALDGISLTVADIATGSFSVSVIPHSMEATILSEKAVGSTVNLENDIIGKYIERFQNQQIVNEKSLTNITREFLSNAGYF